VGPGVGGLLATAQPCGVWFPPEATDYPEVYRQALPYRKMGRKVIFLRQEVETYLHGLPGLQLRHISL
jgi:hypothetical protein